MLELNYDLLRSKLADLVNIEGVNPHQVTLVSKVHNIQRMIEGLTAPTPKSWAKLHKAFPKQIPEPQYMDGKKIYMANNNGSIAGTNQEITNNHASPLSPEEQTLINLLRQKDPTKVYLMKMIAELVMKENL